jgi:hypothetical protein
VSDAIEPETLSPARMKPGDRFLYPRNEPKTAVTVLRERESWEDRFGRPMFRYWCRREDTGGEGWMPFGPDAQPLPVAPPLISEDEAMRARACDGHAFLEMVERGIVQFREADIGRDGGYYVGDLLVNWGGPDGRYHRIVTNRTGRSLVTGGTYAVRDGAWVELTERGRQELAQDRARLHREAEREARQ